MHCKTAVCRGSRRHFRGVRDPRRREEAGGLECWAVALDVDGVGTPAVDVDGLSVVKGRELEKAPADTTVVVQTLGLLL